jgi:glycine betaine transporter
MKKNRIVFFISIGILMTLVILAIMIPDLIEKWTAQIQTIITTTLGWYYLILVTFFVIVCLYFLISPIGRIKLGKQEDKPEFSRPSWLAMLFSAGMGIGLVFWGAAEPLSHYAISTPTNVNPGTDQAIKDSLRFTYFHWGIHAWAIYGIVALVLAYFNFRHDQPALISSTLKPLFGEKVNGFLGKLIDVIAVIATVIGIATTLGFGAVQINGGLSFLYDVPSGILIQFIIIVIVTVLFLISALTGLEKGIKILSNTNMALAAVLLLGMLILGPTILILNLFTETIGLYIQNLPRMSFRIAPLNEEIRNWIHAWTIFYWAWWISWAPFVGIFIARVSKGRSIREFVFGVLLVPTLIGFIWFSTFGGTAIMLEHNNEAVLSNLVTEEVLFAVFEHYPFGEILSIIAILLIGIFFITSADSGTFVLGMMTTNGSLNPGNRIKIIWGVMLSIISISLLYTGGLQALQNTMIVTALPFSIIMGLMTISLIKALYKESKELKIGKIK